MSGTSPTMGRLRPLFLSLGVAAITALGGCASWRETAVDTFPAQAVTETLSVGYGSIAEKYIDSVVVGDLAVEGMRGLGVIDPALTVRRDADQVILIHDAGEVARFAAPSDDDAGGWADLTVRLSQAARDVSKELHDASVEQVYQAVFDAALSQLDPFSRYAGRDEARRNRANRDGFGGIGIRFPIRDGEVRITEVMEGTPAESAGLRVGDKITHVDGAPVADMTSRQLVERLHGAIGTSVNVTVARDGADRPLTVAMKRAHVVSTTVTDSYAGGVLVLTVHRFNQATAETLGQKMKKARQTYGAALTGVILDLRDNPGGLMRQAIRAADLFLTQGEIIKTRGRHPDSVQYYTAEDGDLAAGLPLIILVDGRSASAAEITAAALQDRGRGIVIGTTSFGKGTVQTVIRLPNDGEFTLTWSRFITPSGYLLHDLGVHPTVCTSGTSARTADPVSRLLADRNGAITLLTAWRTVGLADEMQRQRLRAACPAQSRPDTTDVDLGRRLIGDNALYARLLDLANPAAAAK